MAHSGSSKSESPTVTDTPNLASSSSSTSSSSPASGPATALPPAAKPKPKISYKAETVRTSDKPFECTCLRTFARLDALKRHMNAGSNQQCQEWAYTKDMEQTLGPALHLARHRNIKRTPATETVDTQRNQSPRPIAPAPGERTPTYLATSPGARDTYGFSPREHRLYSLPRIYTEFSRRDEMEGHPGHHPAPAPPPPPPPGSNCPDPRNPLSPSTASPKLRPFDQQHPSSMARHAPPTFPQTTDHDVTSRRHPYYHQNSTPSASWGLASDAAAQPAQDTQMSAYSETTGAARAEGRFGPAPTYAHPDETNNSHQPKWPKTTPTVSQPQSNLKTSVSPPPSTHPDPHIYQRASALLTRARQDSLHSNFSQVSSPLSPSSSSVSSNSWSHPSPGPYRRNSGPDEDYFSRSVPHTQLATQDSSGMSMDVDPRSPGAGGNSHTVDTNGYRPMMAVLSEERTPTHDDHRLSSSMRLSTRAEMMRSPGADLPMSTATAPPGSSEPLWSNPPESRRHSARPVDDERQALAEELERTKSMCMRLEKQGKMMLQLNRTLQERLEGYERQGMEGIERSGHPDYAQSYSPDPQDNDGSSKNDMNEYHRSHTAHHANGGEWSNSSASVAPSSRHGFDRSAGVPGSVAPRVDIPPAPPHATRSSVDISPTLAPLNLQPAPSPIPRRHDPYSPLMETDNEHSRNIYGSPPSASSFHHHEPTHHSRSSGSSNHLHGRDGGSYSSSSGSAYANHGPRSATVEERMPFSPREPTLDARWARSRTQSMTMALSSYTSAGQSFASRGAMLKNHGAASPPSLFYSAPPEQHSQHQQQPQQQQPSPHGYSYHASHASHPPPSHHHAHGTSYAIRTSCQQESSDWTHVDWFCFHI
ncbi:hypothetical protein BGZ73_006620 [Actinomortierella ambigua]|nr:hypothetical protein BGZ73_006620 [Actinomortierella ambigua]